MKYKLLFTPSSKRDAKKVKASNLKEKAQEILELLEINPWANPPGYEALKGRLKGAFSRRINIQHRIVYQVLEEEKTVKILRMWTRYE